MVFETKLYDILSIDPTASSDEISRSYRKIALRCHPDKTNHDPQLTEQFKKVTRAYEILKDSNSRNIYDKYGESGLEGNVANKPSGGFKHRSATDVFSQVFSEFNNVFNNSPATDPFSGFPFGGGMGLNFNMDMGFGQSPANADMKKTFRPAAPSGSRTTSSKLFKGKDIHHTCKLSLDDLSLGKILKLQLPRRTKCDDCQGEGGFDKTTCNLCQGSGRVVTTMLNQFTKYQSVGLCQSCLGVGYKYSRFCNECSDGYKVVKKIIQLYVPPGTRDNSLIVLKGAADEGKNIIPGDVVVTVKETKHPYLIRKYDDLYMEYDIDLRTSLLGGSIVLHDFLRPGNNLKIFINVHGDDMINNDIDSTIHDGEVVGAISSEAPKIVKGLGMPINDQTIDGIVYQTKEQPDILNPNQFQRGNLFIKFNVRMPDITQLTHEQLINLGNILPVRPQASPETFSTVHLSNLPNYADYNFGSSPLKSSSVSSTEDNTIEGEPEIKRQKGAI